jgi:hypothetical protein
MAFAGTILSRAKGERANNSLCYEIVCLRQTASGEIWV